MKETTRNCGERINVLGVGVSVLNLDLALDRIREAVKSGTKGYVCVTGVHGVMESQKSSELASIHNRSFLTTPDGMPMVWIGKLSGHREMERVYGPDLMLKVCDELRDAGCRHFFYGGAPGVVGDLKRFFERTYQGIRVVGTYTPPFRPLNGGEKEELAAQIRSAKPDILWVGLSTPKQERFMAEYLPLLDTKLMIGVGAAFDFFTGRARQAPRWMQRSGFEWLFRLFCEPRRLWRRYLLNNPRFIGLYILQLLKSGKDGSVQYAGTETLVEDQASISVRSGTRPLRIAFIGCRGVPARYSGFETLVEQLGVRLVKRGYDVTVYNRDPYYDGRRNEWRGMKIVWLPTVPTKSLDTIVHTFFSIVHALFCGYDWIYICGVGNAPLVKIPKLFGSARLIINVDGADFRRAKWKGFARWWLKRSERKAVKLADVLIADNHEIVKRYETDYQFKPRYISYGAITAQPEVRAGELERWGLKPREYILYVSRLTPENEPDLLLEAYALASGLPPLVIAGSAGYEWRYCRKLKKMAGARVVFTGSRYGDAYAELSQHALFFVMPAAIEATRLVLLDQMGFGAAILYRDIPATREVVGETGVPFGFGASDRAMLLEALAVKMRELASHPVDCLEIGAAARVRAQELFDWDRVVDEYEEIFRSREPGPVG